MSDRVSPQEAAAHARLRDAFGRVAGSGETLPERLVRLERELVATRVQRGHLLAEHLELREALKVAVDDLYKASNQFAGLLPLGSNAGVFERKARRAEAALAKRDFQANSKLTPSNSQIGSYSPAVQNLDREIAAEQAFDTSRRDA